MQRRQKQNFKTSFSESKPFRNANWNGCNFIRNFKSSINKRQSSSFPPSNSLPTPRYDALPKSLFRVIFFRLRRTVSQIWLNLLENFSSTLQNFPTPRPLRASVQVWVSSSSCLPPLACPSPSKVRSICIWIFKIVARFPTPGRHCVCVVSLFYNLTEHIPINWKACPSIRCCAALRPALSSLHTASKFLHSCHESEHFIFHTAVQVWLWQN